MSLILKSDTYTVRHVRLDDVPKMPAFFREAYGEQSVFISEQFLKFYFGSPYMPVDLATSLLAECNETGKVVAFYGCRAYKLQLFGQIVSMSQNANAYTLKDWRRRGISGSMVDYVHNNNEGNLAIGMKPSTRDFYANDGYNAFDGNPMPRFVFNLNEKTYEIIEHIGQDLDMAYERIPIQSTAPISDSNIIQITPKNIDQFQADWYVDLKGTTYRDMRWLKRRLVAHPFIKYDVYAYVSQGKIKAFVALREENLAPQNYKVHRIVDMYGVPAHIPALLRRAVYEGHKRGYIYIDFAKKGNIYDAQLAESNFTKLEGQDGALVPLVTAPIEKRNNHEFVCIQSKTHHATMHRLNLDNAYFTRVDCDRDRVGRLWQIPEALR